MEATIAEMVRHAAEQELDAGKSLGEHLRDWLLKNEVAITDPMFVSSVNLTIRNAIRDARKEV